VTEIRIGVLYPFSGPQAQIGNDARKAIETALDVINNSYPNIKTMLAAGKGLPNLGNAPVRAVYADHKADPEVAASEAQRLISNEKVHAIMGAYQSSAAAAASLVAERNGIPFLAPESSSPALNKRGLKWFFRTTPNDEYFSKAMFEMLDDYEKATGKKLRTVAILNENTLFGSDTSKIQKQLIEKTGRKLLKHIQHEPNATSLTSEVQQLKAADPDVTLVTGYTSDAILFVKTADELGFKPRMIIAQDAGYIEPDFVKSVGKLANGYMTRATYARDLSKDKELVKQISEMYTKRSGSSFTDNTAREFQATMILADAIDRARSTDPEAIRTALQGTNILPDQLIMPWRGVKFDETGYNTLGNAVILQYQNEELRLVWPFDIATAEIEGLS